MNAHRIAATVVSVAVALSLAPLAAPLIGTAAAASSCPDAEVLFARGTGEPPGIGRVGDAFVSALRSQLPDKSVTAYGVNYPANYNFLQATTGATDVSVHIQQILTSCPDTKLVLGGYSQGAAVMDLVTTGPVAGISVSQPLPPEAIDRVAAVALFGNPSNHLGSMLTSLSPVFAAKTIDMCTGNDPVCSPGRSWNAHTAYVQAGMTDQAAAFVAARL